MPSNTNTNTSTIATSVPSPSSSTKKFNSLEFLPVYYIDEQALDLEVEEMWKEIDAREAAKKKPTSNS
jgi:hypothetical protein